MWIEWYGMILKGYSYQVLFLVFHVEVKAQFLERVKS